MAHPLETLAFHAAQRVRTSWFVGQKRLLMRLADPVKLPPELAARMPDRESLKADLQDLLRRDRENVKAGRYLPPEDMLANPVRALGDTIRYVADLPAIAMRRKARAHDEVFRATEPGRYPRYYLQNFHYQTDGYLSARSAALYDHQVEVLFNGAASAMRRQALIPLSAALAGKKGAHLVDLGCGTGRFLREAKANHPRLKVTGVDLSPFYLDDAKKALQPWTGARLLEAPAETTGEPAESADAVSAIFLFHELPPRTRRAVVAEMARLLKPGGTAILLDSIQYGDLPDFDPLIEHFPLSFHEPYYDTYAKEDLTALFGSAGLKQEGSERVYLSKLMWFRKD